MKTKDWIALLVLMISVAVLIALFWIPGEVLYNCWWRARGPCW
jgi:hypothetical protein